MDRRALFTVGVFCGTKSGRRPGYLSLAREFGTGLGLCGGGLVYGAGGTGIMGGLARAALASGASVTGVIPKDLYDRERPDGTGMCLRVVDSMHERKALMYQLSDSFAVLPGGYGTMDELLEVVTWNQLGLHRKAVLLVNASGFFDPLLVLLDHLEHEGFLMREDRRFVQAVDSVDSALDVLASSSMPTIGIP